MAGNNFCIDLGLPTECTKALDFSSNPNAPFQSILANGKILVLCPSLVSHIPVVLSSRITSTGADGILVKWDRDVHATCDIKNQIVVMANGVARAVHSVTFNQANPKEMAIIMSTDFAYGEVVTWAYVSGPCKLEEIAPPHTEADNQTYNVVNSVHIQYITADSTTHTADTTMITADNRKQ